MNIPQIAGKLRTPAHADGLAIAFGCETNSVSRAHYGMEMQAGRLSSFRGNFL